MRGISVSLANAWYFTLKKFLIVGATSSIGVLSVDSSPECSVLRQRRTFDRNSHTNAGTGSYCHVWIIGIESGCDSDSRFWAFHLLYCRVSSSRSRLNCSLSFGWKLALVAISVLPVLVVMGFCQVKLMMHLQDDLRDAFGLSAALVCEQIASIRTIASLRREDALLAEFSKSMEAPVRKAMISTTKGTLVLITLHFEKANVDIRVQSGCSPFH